MIKIPLEQFRTNGPEATVELDDEGGRIRLSLDLEAGELTGRYRPFEEPVFDVSFEPVLGDPVLGDPRVVHVYTQNEELRQYRDALTRHVAYLEERLERAAAERSIDRDLLPDEARSLAAALWHYAGEADAFGRRA